MNKKEYANRIADDIMKVMDEQIVKAMYGLNDISEVPTTVVTPLSKEFTIGKLYYMWAEVNGWNIDYKPNKFLWIHPEDLKEVLVKTDVIMFPDMAGIIYTDDIQRGNMYIIENNENQTIETKFVLGVRK